MKNLYNEFFYVPKHGKGKIREKVMITRISFSVILIVLCMIAMSITAYAYFSHTLTANVAVIQSATWDISVSAEDDVVINDGYYILNNTSAESRDYKIVVSKQETYTSATVGYVRIDIKTDIDGFADVQTYYSQPIGEFLVEDTMTVDTDREIIVTVPAGKVAQVLFIGEWGTCAKEPIIEHRVEPLFAQISNTQDTVISNVTDAETEDITASGEME